MTILLTGVTGQVGSELRGLLSTLDSVVAVDRKTMDLARSDSIVEVMRAVQPSLVVNPAAYTAVDLAESNPELAMAVNAIAPGIIAEEAKRLRAGLVHFSTDYVFDGRKLDPYVESDAPNPLNVYGRTKLAGEKAIAEVGGRYLILRTGWVYAARGKNFLNTMRKLARERTEIRVVDDQRGAPTSARALSEATTSMLGQVASRDWPTGLYHATCAGETTWFGFAQAIMEAGLEPSANRPALIPISSAEYPTPARRPANSVLSNVKLGEVFGIRLPTWRKALTGCLLEATST